MRVQPKFTHSVVAALALALTPVAAFGQGTEEQQQACTPDAIKLCSDTIPDIGKTTACMKAHFAQLSPRCQSAFNDAKPTTKAASRKVEPRKVEPRVAEPRTTETAKVEPARPDSSRSETRSERRSTVRAERRMPEREAALPRDGAPREERASVEPAPAAAYPAYPTVPADPSASSAGTYQATSPRGQIASACRAGLIDSFTCSTTVPALLGGPAY